MLENAISGLNGSNLTGSYQDNDFSFFLGSFERGLVANDGGTVSERAEIWNLASDFVKSGAQFASPIGGKNQSRELSLSCFPSQSLLFAL